MSILLKEERFVRSSKSTFSRRLMLKNTIAVGFTGLLSAPRLSRGVAKEHHPLAGQTIGMSILGPSGWLPSALGVQMSPLFADYAKERYGYEVSFSYSEAPFSELFGIAAASLSRRSQEFNIIISDSQWLGAFAKHGWILQLNEAISKDKELRIEWYSPTIIDAYQVYPDNTRNLWGFPQEGDTIALYLRKDLLTNSKEKAAFLEKYHRPLPQTFEEFENLTMREFEKIAAFFTRPDQQLWGTAMQYSRFYDFATCFLYPFLWSQGGEIWDPKTGQVEGILNSPLNARSMEQARAWLKYQPPDAIEYGIAEEAAAFTQGKLFSCFQWAALGLDMINAENKDKVMVVPPPKHGVGAGARRVYTIGGQPWVINAFNDDAKMRVALDFMKWWYLPETTLEFAKRGGNPCDKATLSRPDFDSINPWNRAYKYMLEPGRSRDFWHDPNYSEMLTLQQDGFTSFLSGKTASAQQALNYIACGQQRILHSSDAAKNAPSSKCSAVSL